MSNLIGQMSLALQQEVLARYLKNTTTLTPQATVYAALATAIPTDAGFTEVSNANGYARKAIAWGSVTAGPPSYVQNTLTEFDPVTTSNWAAVLGWGVYDSGSYGAGNQLWYGALATTISFSAVSVASPAVITTAAHGLSTGTTTNINILTSTATITGAAGGGVGCWEADVVDGTHLALPATCTVTGTGTIQVPTGSVQCNVNDVFRLAAGAITIFLD